MRISPSSAASRRWIAGLVLAAVAFRALIPMGFMPAPGRLFALELCPDGLPVGMLDEPMGPGHAAHDRSGAHGAPHHPGQFHIDHCAFGGASGPALIPHINTSAAGEPPRLPPAEAFTPQQTGGRLAYVPLSRGPPTGATGPLAG